MQPIWSPAQSLDLNSIEHLWHVVNLRLARYENHANGVHELWEKAEREWKGITIEDCRKLIDSMPRRCAAVIRAKGGHTKY